MKVHAAEIDLAKQFLLSKVEEEAQREGVQLSEIEKRMFMFSETSGAKPDFEASERFDAEYDGDEYESKIAKLLRQSYGRDKESAGGKTPWKEALDCLKDEDFYGLVLIDQAGIRSRSITDLPPDASISVRNIFSAKDILFLLIEVSVLAVGVEVVFDPLGWKLVHADWLKLLLMGVFMALIWSIAKIYERKMIPK